MTMFRPAVREKMKLRMAIDGPAGAGKTKTGLIFLHALSPSGKRAVIDTEHGRAKLYQGDDWGHGKIDFETCELGNFSPSTYTTCIEEAARIGIDALLIDSLSHAWQGTGGALELVDKKSNQPGGSYAAWRDVTPMHTQMIEAMLSFPGHLIVTMRSKMEYEMVTANGKTTVNKVGMAPIQRAGMEYEFDVVCDMDVEHVLVVSKTRCSKIDGARVVKPTAEFLFPVMEWLDKGAKADDAAKFAKALANTGNDVAGEHDNSHMANEGQRERAIRIAKAMNMPMDSFRNAIMARGAKTFAELTAEKAQELILKLEQVAASRGCPF